MDIISSRRNNWPTYGCDVVTNVDCAVIRRSRLGSARPSTDANALLGAQRRSPGATGTCQPISLTFCRRRCRVIARPAVPHFTVRPERRETNVPSNIGMMGRLLQQRRRYVICLLAMLLHQCCNFMTTATAEVFRLADGIHLHMLLKYSTVLLRTQNMRHSFTFRHSFHWFTPSLKLTISSNSSHSGKNLWKW